MKGKKRWEKGRDEKMREEGEAKLQGGKEERDGRGLRKGERNERKEEVKEW